MENSASKCIRTKKSLAFSYLDFLVLSNFAFIVPIVLVGLSLLDTNYLMGPNISCKGGGDGMGMFVYVLSY